MSATKTCRSGCKCKQTADLFFCLEMVSKWCFLVMNKREKGQHVRKNKVAFDLILLIKFEMKKKI